MFRKFDLDRAYMILPGLFEPSEVAQVCSKAEYLEKYDYYHKEMFFGFRASLFYALRDCAYLYLGKASPSAILVQGASTGAISSREKEAEKIARQAFERLNLRKFVPNEDRKILGYLEKKNKKMQSAKVSTFVTAFASLAYPFFSAFFLAKVLFEPLSIPYVISLVGSMIIFSPLGQIYCANYRKEKHYQKWIAAAVVLALAIRYLVYFCFAF